MIDEELVNQAMPKFLSYENTKSISSGNNNSSGTDANAVYPVNSNGDLIPVFDENLFAEIQNCVDQVTNIHFKDGIKLAICDSWITKANMGQRGTWHIHQLSFISGLLYLTDHEKSETLFWLDDPFYKNHKTMYDYILRQQEYIVKVQPKKGKLILWDSTVAHKLSPNLDKNIRYTLAFNTFLTGNISQFSSMRLSLHCNDVKEQSNNT